MKPVIAALAVVASLAFADQAVAGWWHRPYGVHYGAPVYYAPPSYYVAPPVVPYYAPVYAPPPIVYYAPPVVAYRPVVYPAYVAPRVGFYFGW